MDPMSDVTSRRNPLVARFRALARGSSDGHLLLDGEHLVRDALAAHLPIEIVALTERMLRARPDLEQACASSAETVIVSDSVMSALSPVKQPSGIVAIASAMPASLERAMESPPQLIPVIAGVQDAGNVGAIIRAAEGCGATGIITTDGSADPFGWKALRGSMGSTLRMPVASRQPLDAAINGLRRQRVRIGATAPRGGTPLPDCDLRGPLAILLGGEGAGLPEEMLRAADLLITIPMRPPVESFNVAITAALILYEAARQRARS